MAKFLKGFYRPPEKTPAGQPYMTGKAGREARQAYVSMGKSVPAPPKRPPSEKVRYGGGK